MTELIAMKCVACQVGAPAATTEERDGFLADHPDWEIIDVNGVPRLQRTFGLTNFVEALEFTNRVGKLAEEENHHPAITTEWGKVTVCWWTHKIKDLHMNDLVAAAKTDALFAG